MRAYVGQTRSASLIGELASHGIGECTQPREYPPRRFPWLLDNAAFSAWRAGRPFDVAGFESCLARVRDDSASPDFLVVPDIVAGGLESLAFSLRWLESLRSSFPALACYLAVQDGMHEYDLPIASTMLFDGLFVGGTLPWKLRTGASWVRAAHRRGLPCHVGRVGTAKRVAWAKRIGADSIDSCLPLFSRENLDSFLRALDGRQMELAL